MFCSSEDIILTRHSLTFWTFAVTLLLNAVIQSFHRTLQLMVLYYQTKFGCKQTNTLEDIAETVIFWFQVALAVTLTLKIENQFFCGIPPHDNTSPYQVWFKNGWKVQEILSIISAGTCVFASLRHLDIVLRVVEVSSSVRNWILTNCQIPQWWQSIFTTRCIGC